MKERSVRLVFDQVDGNGPTYTTIVSVAGKIGCTTETLGRWVRQAERDAGKREGLTTNERDRLKTLKKENRGLKKTNEIFHLASAFFAQANSLAIELDRQREARESSRFAGSCSSLLRPTMRAKCRC